MPLRKRHADKSSAVQNVKFSISLIVKDVYRNNYLRTRFYRVTDMVNPPRLWRKAVSVFIRANPYPAKYIMGALPTKYRLENPDTLTFCQFSMFFREMALHGNHTQFRLGEFKLLDQLPDSRPVRNIDLNSRFWVVGRKSFAQHPE